MFSRLSASGTDRRCPTLIQICAVATITYFSSLNLASGPGGRQETSKAFRRLSIPEWEHGYNQLKSRVIRSKAELEALFEEVSNWNNKKAFEEAVKNAQIDFDKEALVLLTTRNLRAASRSRLRRPCSKIRSSDAP